MAEKRKKPSLDELTKPKNTEVLKEKTITHKKESDYDASAPRKEEEDKLKEPITFRVTKSQKESIIEQVKKKHPGLNVSQVARMALQAYGIEF